MFSFWILLELRMIEVVVSGDNCRGYFSVLYESPVLTVIMQPMPCSMFVLYVPIVLHSYIVDCCRWKWRDLVHPRFTPLSRGRKLPPKFSHFFRWPAHGKYEGSGSKLVAMGNVLQINGQSTSPLPDMNSQYLFCYIIGRNVTFIDE